MTLDEAWTAAEAALPEPGRVACQQREVGGAYEAWAQSATRKGLGFGYGDTPTAALIALTDGLRKRHDAH